jgi:hypothetical protein
VLVGVEEEDTGCCVVIECVRYDDSVVLSLPLLLPVDTILCSIHATSHQYTHLFSISPTLSLSFFCVSLSLSLSFSVSVSVSLSLSLSLSLTHTHRASFAVQLLLRLDRPDLAQQRFALMKSADEDGSLTQLAGAALHLRLVSEGEGEEEGEDISACSVQ